LNILAVKYITRMRGSSRPHLMHCSDGEVYVVKFQGNPSGTRALANDLIASSLARLLRLPVPATAVIDVNEDLLNVSHRMLTQPEQRESACRPGLSFGSRYIPDELPPPGPRSDKFKMYLIRDRSSQVVNRTDFFGALVLDYWTCNNDTRDCIYA
jgi:hypothetical protein